MDVIAWLIGVVVAVVMIVAQCQLFAIRRNLEMLVELQRNPLQPSQGNAADAAAVHGLWASLDTQHNIAAPAVDPELEWRRKRADKITLTVLIVMAVAVLLIGLVGMATIK